MEDQINGKADCGCSDGCCAPPKKKPWTKILFILVILAAVSIIILRFSSNTDGNISKNTGSVDTAQTVAGDSAVSDCSKTCDNSQKSSCCPKNNK